MLVQISKLATGAYGPTAQVPIVPRVESLLRKLPKVESLFWWISSVLPTVGRQLFSVFGV